MLTEDRLREVAHALDQASDSNLLKIPLAETLEQCVAGFKMCETYISEAVQIQARKMMTSHSLGMTKAAQFINAHSGIFEVLQRALDFCVSPHEDADKERFLSFIDQNAQSLQAALQFLRQAFKELDAQKKISLQ